MKIIEYPGFLKESICNDIITRGEIGLKKCDILGEGKPNYRIATGMWFEKNDSSIIPIINSLTELTGLPASHQERPHFVRYDIGGGYKPHHDFFHLGQSYTEHELKKGGQRLSSFLIYLNDNYYGGETVFPKIKMRIKPKKGKAIFWNNLMANGDLNFDSLHAGLPVSYGVKYILIIWVRENPFFE